MSMRHSHFIGAAVAAFIAAPAVAGPSGQAVKVTVTTTAAEAAASRAAQATAATRAASSAQAKAEAEAAKVAAAAKAAAAAAAERDAEAAARVAAASAAAKAEADAKAAAAQAAANEAKAAAAARAAAEAKAQRDAEEAQAAQAAVEAKAAAAAAAAAAAKATSEVRVAREAATKAPAIAAPNSAITFLSASPSDAGSVGTIFAVDYSGFIDAAPAPGLGAFGQFEFLGTADDDRTWNFRLVSLENISALPITAARVSQYGFDVSPDASGARGQGLFDTAELGGNVPMLGGRDVCLRTGPGGSCAGGGGGGLLLGESTSGGFSLFFGASTRSITLENFFVRFQAIEGAGGTSGVGAGALAGITPAEHEAVIAPVPEPGQWAMLIVGFGLAGAVLRRRRPQLALA